jgi:dTDP-4-dehydrorhamnose 3,5-epimerase-like enzyme
MQFKPADSVHELNAKKDPQTVTPEGKRVDKLIDGVVLREATTHLDERGELCEIYNPAWNLSDDAIVYVYQASVRPGKLKGWILSRQAIRSPLCVGWRLGMGSL